MAPSSSTPMATTSKRCAIGRNEGPSAGAANYPRLDAADFDLAGAAFLAAAFFTPAGFALAAGPSATEVFADDLTGATLPLGGAFFAGCRGRATGLPPPSATTPPASER